MRAVRQLDLELVAKIMGDPGAIARPEPFNPHARGYRLTYRGPETACPCCGHSNWLVGRLLAECAFCSAAVPLPERGLSIGPEIPVGRRHRLQPETAIGGHRRSA